VSFVSGLPVRKLAIDAVVRILSDPLNGYNATFPQVLVSGGYPALPVLPNEIDFSDNSRSFAKSYLAGLADMDLAAISDSLSVVIYTTQVQNLGLVMGHRFAGACQTHIDFYIRQQARRFDALLADEQAGTIQDPGMEGSDTESLIAAIEDTAMTVLHAADPEGSLWLSGVVYGLVWQSSTTPLFQVSDGYQQVLQIQFPLEVRIL
jgi:hypothetical protein